jgi:methionyl-tRNA synthetase
VYKSRVWDLLDISDDDFIRTTEERHKRGVQAFWQALHDRDWLYKGHYEGWYCVPCETYYSEDQLTDGECPGCGRTVEFIREDNWFFKLSAFQDELLEHYRRNPGFIQPETRRNEVMSFVEAGLKDLSISRTTFEWGVPLPFDEGHVTYVWIDALLNYVTAVGYGSSDPDLSDRFARYWPAQFHFVGKDIIRFHCVIWPAMLMAAGVELPETVFAHGFLLTKGEKMSKSKGNVLSPQDLVERFGVDAYRYYFLRDVRFGEDGSISMEGMIQRYNGDLANDWGNLVSRLFNMTEKFCEGAVPAASDADDGSNEGATLVRLARTLPDDYAAAMSRLDYGAALEHVWELIKQSNKYLEESAPWALAKNDEDRLRLEAVMYNALEAVRIAAIFCSPVMPETSAEVWRRLGLGDIAATTDVSSAAAWGGLPEGSRVTKGEPLFPRIQDED